MGRNPFNRNVYGRRKLLFRNELHKSYKRARRLDSRFIILISAAVMLIFGAVQKLTKWRWINDYALPVSMIVGMVCSVPIYNAIV